MGKKKSEVVQRTYRVQENVLTLSLGVEAFLEQQPALPAEYRKEGYKFLKNIKTMVIMLSVICCLPFAVNAARKYTMEVKIKYTIYPIIAEFEKGPILNSKMRNMGDVYTFNRSNTLPENVKTLVNVQMESIESITVSDEEVEEKLAEALQNVQDTSNIYTSK